MTNMKYDHPEIIDPALEVIKKTDPDLYAAMVASDWHVHMVTELVQDDMRLDDGEGGELDVLRDNPDAEAMTDMVLSGKPTDIYLPRLRDHVSDYQAPLEHIVATDLVHEFKHHHGYYERDAYLASGVFAAKLGDAKLERNSELGFMQSVFQGQ